MSSRRPKRPRWLAFLFGISCLLNLAFLSLIDVADERSPVTTVRYLFRNRDFVFADSINDRIAVPFHLSIFWTIHPFDYSPTIWD